MNSFLASYTKMESYSHFGAELSDEVKAALARGANLYHLFDQHYSQSVPISVQVVLFGLIWVDALNDRTKDQIHEFRKKMIQAVKNEETSKYFEELIAIEKLDEFSKKINEEKEKLFQIIDSVDTTLPQQETKEIQMIG
jgi:F0F1-type ATP synthase alpha subunit